MMRVKTQESTRGCWFAKPVEDKRVVFFNNGEIKEVQVIPSLCHLHSEFESMVEGIELVE